MTSLEKTIVIFIVGFAWIVIMIGMAHSEEDIQNCVDNSNYTRAMCLHEMSL